MEIQPIPTDFNGIRYRSKSEAMFACYLQVAGERLRIQCGFEYEPGGDKYEVDGWRPDFLLYQVVHGNAYHVSMPTLHYSIIEYKPRRPAQAYVDKFAKRCQTIIDRFEAEEGYEFSRRLSCELFYGSVFNQERGRIDMGAENPSGLIPEWFDEDWLSPFEEDVRSHRYDLCGLQVYDG